MRISSLFTTVILAAILIGCMAADALAAQASISAADTTFYAGQTVAAPDIVVIAEADLPAFGDLWIILPPGVQWDSSVSRMTANEVVPVASYCCDDSMLYVRIEELVPAGTEIVLSGLVIRGQASGGGFIGLDLTGDKVADVYSTAVIQVLLTEQP